MNKNILDIGCGNRKLQNAIGIDINPKSSADIICDLNIFPYPFKDSTFDMLYMDNVLEHLNDVINVMNELYRISRPGALLKIKVPYFRSKWAFVDHTHKHFFTVESFAYFIPGSDFHKAYRYSEAKFRIEKIVFNEDIIKKKIITFFIAIIKFFANRWPIVYEMYISNIFPLDELTFYLRVL